ADLAARLSALPEVDRVVAIDDFLPKNQAEKLDAIEFTAFGLETALLSPPPVRGAELPPPLERLLLALEGLDSAEAQRFASVTQKLKTAGPALERYAEADIFAFWPDLIERLKLQIQAEFVEEETLPTGLKDRFIAQDGRIRLQIEPSQNVKDPAALAQFVDAVTTIAPGVAGGARSVLQSGRVVSHAMLQAGLLALGIVTLVLWVLVRDSVFVGVLLFCLLLAGVLTAAAGVVLGVPFNFANVIVAPLLIGVGADSGIHLGLRARRAAAPSDVFETSSPKAVFYSALTTIASFGTLALSDHRGVASMGALLAISLFFAFLCTALVQPWLLEKVDRSR
ncbi:MAG: MMPL family transporter, partial [Pseudomonadota bacterium]